MFRFHYVSNVSPPFVNNYVISVLLYTCVYDTGIAVQYHIYILHSRHISYKHNVYTVAQCLVVILFETKSFSTISTETIRDIC